MQKQTEYCDLTTRVTLTPEGCYNPDTISVLPGNTGHGAKVAIQLIFGSRHVDNVVTITLDANQAFGLGLQIADTARHAERITKQ